jgi:hypothetical protein
MFAVAEDLRVGRVADLAVHGDHAGFGGADRAEGFAVGTTCGHELAWGPGRQADVASVRRGGLGGGGRTLRRDEERAQAAELGDRSVRVGERFAVEPVAVLDRGDAFAFDDAGEDHDGTPVGFVGLGVGVVDFEEVVAVDLDRAPPEGAGTGSVGGGVPAEHRLAALAQAVDVGDCDQVVEAGVCCAGECLPDRAFGELAVPGEDPDAVGKSVECFAGERDPYSDGEAEPERAGGDLDPRQSWGGVPLESAAHLAVAHELFVGDRARGAVERVEKRRRVAFGEDQVVVGWIIRSVEVVAEVVGEENGYEISGGHPGARMSRARGCGGAHGVDAELLRELTPEGKVVSVDMRGRSGHVPTLCARSMPGNGAG